LKLSFLGKDSIFVPPFAQILKWLGGIPVDRSVSHDRVAEMVDAFNLHDRLVFGLTPEGTRKRVTEWKTGFYHVAVGARVPIVAVAFDYGRKALIIKDPFYPTGNVSADIAKVRAFFADITPKRPENFVP
jgi:1-acyl-sn-glycerol-3-phosphate acyltransferase